MAKSNLPKGWEWKKIGEACQINPRRGGLESYGDETKVTFIPMSAVDEERGVITAPEIKHLGEVKKGYTFFRENDVLFAKITPCMQNGKSTIARNLVNGLGFGSTEFHVLRPQNNVLTEWIYHLVRQKWFRDLAATHFTGSVGQQRVPAEFLENQEVPIPPLEEQRRIVARIEELLSRLEQAKSLRQNALTETSTIMPSALHEVFSRAAETGWETVTIEEITEKVVDGPHKTPTYVEDGIPFVTVRNIVSRHLDFTDLKFISSEDHAEFCKRGKVEKGDVLYTKDGTLGIPCLVDTGREFSFFVSVALIKPKRNCVLGKYLRYALDTPSVHERVEHRATGAALKHIVLREIKALKIPLPSLGEQRRIVAYLNHLQEKIDKLKRLQSETQKELDQTTQSILSKAFQGKLV